MKLNVVPVLNSILNGAAHYTQSHHYSNGKTILVVLPVLLAEIVACFAIAYGLFTLVRNIPALYHFTLRKCGLGEQDISQAFLELTFPADTTKSAYATEQLHILQRGLVKYYGFKDSQAARKKPYSNELVATNDEGIRYVLMIPKSEAENVRRDLLSFLPGLKVREIEDYARTIPDETTQIVELKLNGDFVLSLKDHKTLEEHDFMAFLTGHMTNLASDELVAYQIVTVPVYKNTHHRVTRRKYHFEGRISQGKEVSSRLKRQRTAGGYLLWLLWFPPLWFLMAMGKIVAIAGDILFSMFSNDHELPEFMKSNKDKQRADNPYDQEISNIVKTKLDQQLYEVTIRVLVSSPNASTVQSRLDAIVASFRPFRTTYQSLGVRQPVPLFSRKNKSKQLEQFKARVLSPHHLSQQTILSSSELSDLYHFPNTDMVKTEGFVKSRSKELAAPLSIRRSTAKLDVLVGANQHGGAVQPIGMTLLQRQKHTYVIGKTGTGKTTMLTGMIYQDMLNGKGLAVLDPHGDMFRELLQMVPSNRREDVVVFDPSDRDFPIGLNMLDPGVEFANEDDKHDQITSAVLSVFERLADEKQWGPRMEHILTNATLTALQLPNPTLYTIQRLLTEKSYQREVAKGLKDPVLKQFWAKEFKLMGTMQMSSAVSPLTHRLGHFITTKRSRHILMQRKSALRIGELMDEGKILLVNLSKGDIGEDQSFFFGTILTSLIWMAALQRSNTPERERRDFFLYVDEFQNFATKQFTEITSEGRKYHIPLIASHQNIAQIEDKNILKIVAGNAHAMICLKASPDDEAFILPFMEPEVEKGGIVNLSPHHFYMKTTSDESEDAFSGETVPFEVEKSVAVAHEVVANSRKQYGTPVKKVEAYLEKLLAEPVKNPKQARKGGKKNDAPKTSKKPNSSEGDEGKGVHGA